MWNEYIAEYLSHVFGQYRTPTALQDDTNTTAINVRERVYTAIMELFINHDEFTHENVDAFFGEFIRLANGMQY